MVICGSYMFEFNASNDMKKKNIIREVAVGKVAAHLCLTLIVKELKIIVEHDRVVTTLNIIFFVVIGAQSEDFFPFKGVYRFSQL
jgi:hypothetical protein